MKKSVLISGGCLAVGGIKTHLQLLCSLLRDSKVDVLIFATGNNWTYDDLVNLLDIGVKFMVPPRILSGPRRGAQLSSYLCLPFNMYSDFTSLYCISSGRSHLLAHKLKAKHVFSIYHEITECPSQNSIGAKCIQTIENVVASSIKIQEQISSNYLNSRVKSVPFLIPPPISLEDSKNQNSSNHESRLLRMVFLGRMVVHKRPQVLVNEWMNFSRLFPIYPARLDIYGCDPDNSMLFDLQDQIDSLSISDEVCIHGDYEIQDLDEILADADLVILPSLMEGLPLVLIEAMQRGIPVVSTCAGGIEELGFNNPDVIITDLSWQSFINGLQKMCEKLRLGQVDSERLCKWTELRYGFNKVSEKWLKLLLEPKSFFGL
jgi:glycosyltransferase involved in cell wall biosynthesis